jgi:hypothetical protein
MGCNNNKCNKMDFPKMTKEQKDAFYQKVFSGENKNHFVDKPDRFVLEEDISHQEDINDHLNLLIEDILDAPKLIDADEIVNTLQGIINIHELRTHKLWEHFIMIFELDEYRPCNSDKNCYNPDKKVDPFDPFKE